MWKISKGIKWRKIQTSVPGLVDTTGGPVNRRARQAQSLSAGTRVQWRMLIKIGLLGWRSVGFGRITAAALLSPESCRAFPPHQKCALHQPWPSVIKNWQSGRCACMRRQEPRQSALSYKHNLPTKPERSRKRFEKKTRQVTFSSCLPLKVDVFVLSLRHLMHSMKDYLMIGVHLSFCY